MPPRRHPCTPPPTPVAFCAAAGLHRHCQVARFALVTVLQRQYVPTCAPTCYASATTQRAQHAVEPQRTAKTAVGERGNVTPRRIKPGIRQLLLTHRMCFDMHEGHAYHMHEPGSAARLWTVDAWWAARTGVAHICNTVWCICLSNRPPVHGTTVLFLADGSLMSGKMRCGFLA